MIKDYEKRKAKEPVKNRLFCMANSDLYYREDRRNLRVMTTMNLLQGFMQSEYHTPYHILGCTPQAEEYHLIHLDSFIRLDANLLICFKKPGSFDREKHSGYIVYERAWWNPSDQQ